MKLLQKSLLPAAIALIVLAPALHAQDLDMRSLDRLASNAKSTTNLTLNKTMLKMAGAILGHDNDPDTAAIKSLIANLRAIYVRVYKFDRSGEYSDADLAPLRAMLSQPKWSAVVDIKENKTTNQIYFLEAPNDKLGGVAIINAEPSALTVIYVDGELNPEDVAKLSGNFGLPDIQHLDELKFQGVKPETKKDDNKNRK
jgi:hypothetical protein